MSYHHAALSDACDMAEKFIDEIVSVIASGNEPSTFYGDYYNQHCDGVMYHYQNHVDMYYSPAEAVELLEELADHEQEEDDPACRGWKSTLSSIAARTYGNAVASLFAGIIEEINNDDELHVLRAEFYHRDWHNDVVTIDKAAIKLKRQMREAIMTLIRLLLSK